jgi:adenylate cyclase
VSSSIQFGEFILEMSERRLTRAGRPVALEPKTYDLLVILARYAGRLLTKRELLDLVWPESFVEEGILAVHVSNLRRVLGDSSRRRRYIETISRSGYRFIGRVTEADVTRSPQSTKNIREPSIAVLPFENMSGEKENEYFSDGLAEEISNALARIPELKVIARTSAFAFKGKHEDVRRIAAALGVSTVLEGSIRRAGCRVRVTAQLITGADGSHLWSERYEREMTDVFAIQDEIAQAIVGALHVQLSPRPGPVRHSPKLPAYDALLKGRHHMLGVSAESLARANECFDL